MGTYTALHVRTTDVEGLVAELSEWLGSHAAVAIETRRDEVGLTVYGSGFATSAERPTIFAIASLGDGWLVAHFNCFSDMADLAPLLSARFGARVIVVNAQTTSDAYLLAVYEHGCVRRVLEYCDGLTRNEGEPFAFEGEIFGIDDDELPPTDEWAFGADELEALCARLGLRVWDHPEASDRPQHWSVIRVATGVRPRWLARLSERLGLRR
ncbi:MAG: hypothetical protein U0610_16600 [bacterium]